MVPFLMRIIEMVILIEKVLFLWMPLRDKCID